MFEQNISNLNDFIDLLIPSEEEINTIVDKLNNNEELDFYDNIVIDRLRLIHSIINNKGGRI